MTTRSGRMAFMDLKAVGRRVKAARMQCGLTQDELAEKAELSTTHISCIERGVKPPKLDTFVKIANVLGVTSDVLLQDVLEARQNTKQTDIAVAFDALSYEDQERVRKIIQAFSAND